MINQTKILEVQLSGFPLKGPVSRGSRRGTGTPQEGFPRSTRWSDFLSQGQACCLDKHQR